ncbi:MAG: thioredoxin family protein [Actinomycetota bacterium]|jgi:thiol-disulfide isomerase/thioredoxin|nr:thioredoxin family protein [Actinomycetota bacterium]
MKPVVDRLMPKYEGKVDFVLYEIEKDATGEALAEEYGVQFIPTFVFLNSDGTEADRMVGEVSESTLKSALDRLE